MPHLVVGPLINIMKTVPILISQHYFVQAKYRFGLNRDKAKELAMEAWVLGDDLPDELKEFYIHKTQPNPPNTTMKIYEDKCFVFGLDEPTYPKAVTLFSTKGDYKN